MKLHRQKIVEGLSNCSAEAKAFFAFLCAERQRNCCWAYQQANGANMTPFFYWSDVLFDSFSGKKPTDANSLGFGIEELTATISNGGDPLAVQAQGGVICLVCALYLLTERGGAGLVDAVDAITCSLDNYDFHVRNQMSGDIASPTTDYPLLQREISRQLADVEIAKNFDNTSASALAILRVSNLQFAVPIAAR